MNKKVLLLIIILSVSFESSLFSTHSVSATTQAWELDINKKGIKVFKRKVAGSPIKEFKAICIIDSSIYVIGKIMMDFTSYPEWVDSCIEVKKLSCKNPLHCKIYYAIDLPWPFSDRDTVLDATAQLYLSKGLILANIKSVKNPKIKFPSNRFRLKTMRINWVLKEIAPGKTSIIFTSWADPAGHISAPIANFASGKIPYKTLLGLMKMAKNPVYIQAAQGINEHNYKSKLMMNE